jgi:hypothetical protein
MGGRQWTTPTQADFLTSLFQDYLNAQKSDRFDKFWANLNHQWFLKFPEVVTLPARDPGLAPLTADEQKSILDDLKAAAIKKRKRVSFFATVISSSKVLTLSAFTATENVDALAG